MALAAQDEHKPGDGRGKQVTLFERHLVHVVERRLDEVFAAAQSGGEDRGRVGEAAVLLGERLEGADKPAVGGDAEPERG